MNDIPTGISTADISDESGSFLARHPRFTAILKRLFLVRDNSTIAANTQRIATKVDHVLEKTPEVLVQEKIISILCTARKTFLQKGTVMSAIEQDKFFTLCYSLYLKEETIVCDNPQANIGPLKKYLAFFGTSVNELEKLCGINE